MPRHSQQVPPQRPAPHSSGPVQFSLETLLLVITLAAICLALFGANRVLGICISALAVGALLRTGLVARCHRRQGLAFELPEKIGWFVISLGVILGALFVAFVAFGVVVGIGSMIERGLWGYGPPRAPDQQIGAWLMAVTFGTSALVAPPAAGIWFLWHTRPR